MLQVPTRTASAVLTILTALALTTSCATQTEPTLPDHASVDGTAPNTAPVSAARDLRFEKAQAPRPAAAERHTFAMSQEAFVAPTHPMLAPEFHTEQYDAIAEPGFVTVAEQPRSTFSVDVDTASYANVRRLLREGRLPPAGAVRIEELLNYFSYDYPEPSDERPFSVTTEVGPAPWHPEHQLVLIGLQGRHLDLGDVPPRNLVFLLDVSGSMRPANKLALVQGALRKLVDDLRPEDHISIVVYAGGSGIVLAPTSGRNKSTILEALDGLHAGGATDGASGIRLAYDLARKHFNERGINRVILATDGDFNVGTTSRSALVEIIEGERASGVFLTVLGVGVGNLKDATMEQLADRGNGNYAYLDSPAEARKVLVEEASGTLITIAQDVKLQLEFNPRRVDAYRLIGYENRRLANRDFNDDTKDAGEIGAGHSVTALYEIVPAGADADIGDIDALRYQAPRDLTDDAASDELLTVKLRYQEPGGSKSTLHEVALRGDTNAENPSTNFRFAAAVASFGMALRDSPERGTASFAMAQNLAKNAIGPDPHGYRAELIRLTAMARDLTPTAVSAPAPRHQPALHRPENRPPT